MSRDDHARSPYSAASSLLGYLYQCRYALLDALNRLRNENSVKITIETVDDVTFEQEWNPADILQIKHHITARGNLSDSSPEIWKTLQVWINGLCNARIESDARFFLVTTGLCAAGTAAAYLRPEGRCPKEALRRLSAAASGSTNKANLPAYRSFTSLSDIMRERFVNSITVLDGSPSITELDEHLRKAVFFGVERRHLDSYVNRIEGWWYQRVVAHLTDETVAPISGEELESECNRIREQFRQDSLVIDNDIIAKVVDTSQYKDFNFVKQLNLIDVSSIRKFHAIRNYYRAFAHRSRWVREDLVLVGELERYDDALIEEWEIVFNQMKDRLDDGATESKKVVAAQSVYEWAENGSHRRIRDTATEPFIARGSYQMLADVPRVGWHPEYHSLMDDTMPDGDVLQ